ncbi:MAG: hypothetical protein ABI353_02495 [Isosphaeraceae bacterium]
MAEVVGREPWRPGTEALEIGCGLALLAGPYRVASDDLRPSLERFGLTSEATPIEAIDESRRTVRDRLDQIRKV